MKHTIYSLITILLLLVLLAACARQPTVEEAQEPSDTTQTDIAAESEVEEAASEEAAPTAESEPTEEVVEEADTTSTNSVYTITDAGGNTLTFEEPPTQFVSMGNRDIEMLAALGIVPAGVADVGHLIETVQNPAYFPQPTDIPVIPWDGEIPDPEVLLDLQPDVVFAWEEILVTLEDTDLNVYGFYLNNGPSTWREGIAELRKLADLTGRQEQAEAVIQRFEDRLAAYKALSPMDRSVMIVGVSSDTEFWISTEVSGRCNLILEVATCPWPDPTDGGSWSYSTTVESILTLDPDVIIVDNWGEWSTEEMYAELESNPLWNELTAVQENRVTPILEDYAYIQGVGPIGNMRFLDLYMPVFYPDAFPESLTEEQVQEILAQSQ